jgi:non-heme chloroperoxidase
MPSMTAKDGASIFYKDWGTGNPIVFSHGWPLTADAWDAQMLFLGTQGYRVIAHDRRGHGRSDQTRNGNEMNTYAEFDPASRCRH